MKFNITTHQLDGRVLSIHAPDELYVGAGNAFINFSRNTTLHVHSKSVRAIAATDKQVGCGSYDGTAVVFSRPENKLIETIEGPDTEIKGIAFHENKMALCTRGKTVWVLEDLEISKILDDHSQDVKGCAFHGGRLYSWSYDNTIKMYELFELDHSWELMQSLDLNSIVWSVVFIEGCMVAATHDGCVSVFEMNYGLWVVKQTKLLSACPIMSMCVAGKHVAAICNRNCVAVFDSELNIVAEQLLGGECPAEILSCCYWEGRNAIVGGAEDGKLYIAEITLE